MSNTLLEKMAHNVPAVYEVLGARKGKRKGVKSHSYPAFAFAGRTKSGGDKTAQRADSPAAVFRSPSRPPNRRRRRKRKQTCYAMGRRILLLSFLWDNNNWVKGKNIMNDKIKYLDTIITNVCIIIYTNVIINIFLLECFFITLLYTKNTNIENIIKEIKTTK